MSLPSRWRICLATYARLGLASLRRVMLYRIGLRSGLHRVRRISGRPAEAPFFAPALRDQPGLQATSRWVDAMLAFGAHRLPLYDPPQWNADPFHRDRHCPNETAAWHAIPDFSEAGSDIKAVWEASRMDWAPSMAQRAALGDQSELDRLNRWIANWQAHAPPYLGPNWKCGQEASIRVLHLAAAALILDQTGTPLPGLLALIEQHLVRIAPTTGYAKGQDNNHGTSEASALFVGGSWLALAGSKRGAKWAQQGRALLEGRLHALIAEDGTFSQYSVVYHRLLLDCCAFAEIWRRRHSLPSFSASSYRRLADATRWLHQMVDLSSGDAPNLGANDGAHILPLSDAPFRDFRPSLQLAANLFLWARAIAAPGPWDLPGLWLGLASSTGTLASPSSRTLDDGGIHVLRVQGAVAYFRYPRFRFRPSQADSLHVDLWIGGTNLLRDGGTFSYAAGEPELSYFSGVESHNTVQFDDREQMPRLGRFLLGAWPKASNVIPVDPAAASPEAAAGYRDWLGASHHRAVTLEGDRLICIDRLSGKAATAVIRWRLAPGQWSLGGSELIGDGAIVRFFSDTGPIDSRIAEGWESRHYLQKTALPVLELRIAVPATVTTEVWF